jgi:steroid 5-alpha reductase family enzyme
MTLVWLGALNHRDTSLVDRFWGAAFVGLAWTYALLGNGDGARTALLLTLVTVWGVRLAGHITWRNWGQGEDRRYARMRERYQGSWDLASLWRVFWLQGLLAWIVAWPLAVGLSRPEPAGLTGWDVAAAVVWLVGFTFEAGGDYQLARFKADPANEGEVMDRGFWRYTRHPNYFGDFAVWWGHWLIAVAAGGWWTVFGPVVMSVFLVKVSGVALLERDLPRRRPAYADYVRRTPAFFPWFPKEPRGG